MDMYQKRKARKEKSVNSIEENNNKTNINWAMGIYANTTQSTEK